jgi:chaperonin GroEL (HSP60 family)
MNQNMVEIHTEDAKDQYKKELAEIENQRYVSKQYIEAKERLARIACKSAMIYVGGNNTLEKKMNDDALDDAIHACQSTANYGYTSGNNIAIFRAIKEVQSEIDDENLRSVGVTLYKSFVRVIYRIHANKNPQVSLREVENIIQKSVELDQCYDLNTEEYSPDIINSARTDIEVLMSAITIIGTILSANQYLATEIQTQKSDK